MPEQTVTLEVNEWQQVLAVLANAQGPGITWAVTNPLLMKLGSQLQLQAAHTGGPGNGALNAQWDGDQPAGADAERSAGGRAAQRAAGKDRP